MSLRWLRDQILTLGVDGAYKRMSSWAETVPVGAGGLLFLPYLTGERTPHMDPQARGLFLGLTASHGRAELVRAVMEGVVLACYDAYSVLVELGAQPARIVLGGGGARSRLWQQIVADVFNLPVQPLVSADQAGIGAVLLAGSGVGLLQSETEARSWVSYGDILKPSQRNHAIYQELLSIFRAAYEKHRLDFETLKLLT